jgi:hypothetical protein
MATGCDSPRTKISINITAPSPDRHMAGIKIIHASARISRR